jgi:hypothetical protein
MESTQTVNHIISKISEWTLEDDVEKISAQEVDKYIKFVEKQLVQTEDKETLHTILSNLHDILNKKFHNMEDDECQECCWSDMCYGCHVTIQFVP